MEGIVSGKRGNIMKKVVFFEWTDQEEFIVSKYKIEIPFEYQAVDTVFELSSAQGYEVVSFKSQSQLSHADLDQLKNSGCKHLALRCAGFDMLDVDYAASLNFKLSRVAAYSPESIAEFALTLMLHLARKINLQQQQHQASDQSRGFKNMGFLLKGKQIGLYGYGKIAKHLAHVLRVGFGAQIYFFDPYVTGSHPDQQVESLAKLCSKVDILSVHTPLTSETKHSINRHTLANLKPDFMLINTSRGEVLKSQDVKTLYKKGKIKYLGLDVWGQHDKFDPDFLTLNSIQTNHVAFLTETSVYQMIVQTLQSIQGPISKENLLPLNYSQH